MRIFLAGGGVKALDPRFPSRRCKKKREMQIYLAGQNGMHRILKERRTQCSYTSPVYGPGGMGGV